MATIDTSIYQMNPLRSVQQYENDIIQGRLGQQSLQQNALALEAQRGTLAEQQRKLQEQEAIRTAVSGLGANASPDQQINALRGLATPTAYAQAESLQKQLLDRQKQTADVGKTEAETRAKDLESRYKALEYGVQSLNASQSPQQAAQLINNGVTAGHWSMQDAQELLQSLPQTPQEFAAWKDAQLKRVIPAKDAVEAEYKGRTATETERANKARESGLARVAAETARHNKVAEDLKKQENENKGNELKVAGGKQAFESENKLRDEYQKQSNTFVKVRDAFSKVNAAATDPSPAGDIALIFAYMKILDPDSVVREGEFATAQNAASIPSQIVNAYNKALEGERLNPAQRKDMVGQARKVYNAQKDSQDQLTKNYKGLAKSYGLREENIITDVSLDAPQLPPGPLPQQTPLTGPLQSGADLGNGFRLK